jgi:flagellar biosynthesis/type III secretory pathway M-ring protein FliF/YscJ
MPDLDAPVTYLVAFLILWVILYWVVPPMLMRRRSPLDAQTQPRRYLTETGSLHRLARDAEQGES